MTQRIQTLCVKEANDKRTTRPHQLPIYATSSFDLETVEEGMDIFRDPRKGHLYARFNNPTVDAVADKIARLEAHGTTIEAPWALMTSSGMSAITTVIMANLQSGDKVLTQGNLYGGTTELIKNLLPNYGIDTVLTQLTDIEQTRKALEEDPAIKLVYFETPSNPALDCIDIQAVTELAHQFGAVTVIDNTFCTPVVQQPFLYGVDFIIHSTTKYLNGHGNSISGVIVGKSSETYQKVWNLLKLMGTNCNAWDAWLVNNGMKTLALRMQKHSENALALSRFLRNHPNVDTVNYLGLKEHPYHELSQKQMKAFGGMMCFEVKGGFEAGVRFMNALSIGSLAPTMGDVDTLIMHPASMSHLNIEKHIREENGISDGLIRVSVGIEDENDLMEDFDRALKAG